MIWWQRFDKTGSSMLTAIIATHESERSLVPTLTALIPGASAGLISEVIVADAGSSDATAEVADLAGCRFISSAAPLGARLSEAATQARAPWLLFLRTGTVPDVTWIDETTRFINETRRGGGEFAATFRPAPMRGRQRALLIEALALLGRAIGARARPEHGLLIAKSFYKSLGGHDSQSASAEADLLRRLGRRRIVMLGAGISGG
jgi:glycosyltransferase involved in cell wall biosynthesis